VKINDIQESKQLNELDLSPLLGTYGNAKLGSMIGNEPGAKNIENKMAMDLFIKKFVNNAAAATEQAVQSGLVSKTPVPAQQATQQEPAQAEPAQAKAQSPEEIRKQKLAANAKVAQDQMKANPAPAKPATPPSPEQIRQQKQGVAAKTAQDQMAPFSKLPANQPAVQAQNIRQQKQAAAAKAAQAQMTPKQAVPVKQAPVANKQPPTFNAQNVMKMPGMQKQLAKKVPAMAESTKFDRLNNLFESIVQEAGQQSISQYLIGFFNKFMKGVDPLAVKQAMPQVQALAKEAEASYPKMGGPLNKLAQLGWAVSHQQGEEEPEQTPTETPAPASSSDTLKQVQSLISKLDDNGKKQLLNQLQQSMKTTSPAKDEPISVGGQTIDPSDPLYAKMKQQLAGK